jgi:hypothetical protein
MLRGATWRAEEMAGTAVLRIVVSSDSVKKATATSHGKRRFDPSDGSDEDGVAINGPEVLIIENGGRNLSATSILAPAISFWSPRGLICRRCRAGIRRSSSRQAA